MTEGARALPPLLDPPLLTPARLLGWLRLDEVGTGRRAARQVLTAVGYPRDRSAAESTQIHYELEFDAEHGTMLRVAAYDERRCLQLTEAKNIAYGHELDPQLFTAPTAATTEGPATAARDEAAADGRNPAPPGSSRAADRVSRTRPYG